MPDILGIARLIVHTGEGRSRHFGAGRRPRPPPWRVVMIPESRSSRYRLAVLIDAETRPIALPMGSSRRWPSSAKPASGASMAIFPGPRLKLWADILSKHAIIPQQNFAYTQGKNASDIALVIDAMDLPTAAASTGSASCPRTAISPGWRRGFASRDRRLWASASRRRRRASARPAAVHLHREPPRKPLGAE